MGVFKQERAGWRMTACLVVLVGCGCKDDRGGFSTGATIYPTHHAEPAWSRQGLIAYFDYGVVCVFPNGAASQDPALSGIWLIDPDSGDRSLVLQGAWLMPAWSPDGREIAVFEPASRNLFVVDVETRIVRQLTTSGESYYPSWSPAGDLIAFASGTGPSRIAQLSLIRPDGTGCRVLESAGLGASQPSWNPDAADLLFVRSPGTPRTEIMTLRLESNVVTRLTTTDAGEERPRYSPDGLRIAFSAPSSTTRLRDIWVMNADGTSAVQVTFEGGVEPDWSADGTRIVYRRENGSVNLPENEVLWVVDPVTGGQRQLTTKWPDRCAADALDPALPLP